MKMVKKGKIFKLAVLSLFITASSILGAGRITGYKNLQNKVCSKSLNYANSARNKYFDDFLKEDFFNLYVEAKQALDFDNISKDKVVKFLFDSNFFENYKFNKTEVDKIIDAIINAFNIEKHYNLEDVVGVGSTKLIFKSGSQAIVFFLKNCRREYYFKKELSFLTKYCHKNIAEIFYANKESHFFVQDLALTDLSNFLENINISLADKLEISKAITNVILFLHDNNIVFRDLKHENILVFQDPSTGALTPKLTDFGLAEKLAPGCYVKEKINFAGTPFFMAPETYFYVDHTTKLTDCSIKDDIYSLGLLIYNIFSNNPDASIKIYFDNYKRSKYFEQMGFISYVLKIFLNKRKKLNLNYQNIPEQIQNIIEGCIRRAEVRSNINFVSRNLNSLSEQELENSLRKKIIRKKFISGALLY